MQCRPLYLGHQVIGHRFDGGDHFVFFGNRHLNEKALFRMFSQYHFQFLKQTHSDRVQLINHNDLGSNVYNADASITTQPNLALGIYTADCLPVLIFDPTNKKIAAIHAGWRGVASRIILKTISELATESERLKVWIGPHIRTKNFEVHTDVASQLQSAHTGTDQVIFEHPNDPSKRLVDLTTVAVGQALSVGVLRSHIFVSEVNTFESSDYFSYRRDGSTGRLLSFIVRVED